jgi:hypothetical protein
VPNNLQELAALAGKRLSQKALAAIREGRVAASSLGALIGADQFDVLLALTAMRSELSMGHIKNPRRRKQLQVLVDDARAINPEFFDSLPLQRMARKLLSAQAQPKKKKPKISARPKAKIDTIDTIHYAPAVAVGRRGAHCVFDLEVHSSKTPLRLQLAASDLVFLSVGSLTALQQELSAIPESRKMSEAELIDLHGIGAGIDEARRLLRAVDHKIAKLLHHPPRKP